MRFKLDENLPEALVSDLAASGHDATTCWAEGIAGQGDPTIASHATSEGRVLLTYDLDFSDIRRYPPGSHAGIVIFRIHSQDIASCRQALQRMLNHVAEPDYLGCVIIVEDARIRIRRA